MDDHTVGLTGEVGEEATFRELYSEAIYTIG